jgi:hypothetical protein
MGEGDRVLLVEDLTTDGGSKLSFVDAIRETGAECAHTAVIFYYDIFPETPATLAAHGVTLHHLCTWWDVLAEARDSEAFDSGTLSEVERFLNAPRPWQEARAKGVLITADALESATTLKRTNGYRLTSLAARPQPVAVMGLSTTHPQQYTICLVRAGWRISLGRTGDHNERRSDTASGAAGTGGSRGHAAQHRGRAAASGRHPDQQRRL